MKKLNDINAALCQFVDAASKHAEASQTGDYKIANKSYKEIANAYTFLKDHDSLLVLLDYLDHKSTGVRIWAATYVLPINEKKGIATLEDVGKSTQGILSSTAKTTLSEWLKGNLKRIYA
ncbi:DUF2019 domain-containing protein [Mucilaginibacter sp. SG564]|uniref:DUF2019 domain-containing protein n=1 Tax=Mucilaginibacter sp. SG564 TaxID=2587022 RepID=UPI00155396EA|nr:DUF2019 domain-containing protein [Mucilaginibacter sp. SG564]NOW94687.1 hypothetical protein [Mucilaginibacter sp. SG564]